jgi:hypothetical protein
MGALADQIRQAVRQDRFIFSAHADDRLRDRRIMGWQVIAGIDTASLLAEFPDAHPNPTAEFECMLADGASCKAVWSWIAAGQTAKLVTVHFFDR